MATKKLVPLKERHPAAIENVHYRFLSLDGNQSFYTSTSEEVTKKLPLLLLF